MGVIDPRQSPCYSRTCPVRITHPFTGSSTVGLAIIDDQSGVTFVSPSIKHLLTIPESSIEASMQSVITIEGPSSSRPCEIKHNLIVSPLTGNSEIELPPSVMQNPIPHAWNQIPSPEDVASIKGFSHLAGYFPEKDPKWPTLLLIGRDCIEAQWQQQYHAKGENLTPVSYTHLTLPTKA